MWYSVYDNNVRNKQYRMSKSADMLNANNIHCICMTASVILLLDSKFYKQVINIAQLAFQTQYRQIFRGVFAPSRKIIRKEATAG